MCQPVGTVLEELNKSSKKKKKRIVYPREMLCQSRSEGWPLQRPLVVSAMLTIIFLADMHHVKSEERNEERKRERKREWMACDGLGDIGGGRHANFSLKQLAFKCHKSQQDLKIN